MLSFTRITCIFFMVISIAHSQLCTIDTFAAASNACIQRQISVYKHIPDDSNSWEKWVELGISALAKVTDKITKIPVATITTKAMTLLYHSIGKEQTSKPNHVEFQHEVNIAFSKLQKCITDQIKENNAKNARTDLYAIRKDFFDVATAAQLEDLADQVHDIITRYFDFGAPHFEAYDWRSYSYYLVVFEETAVLYDQIWSVYLSYLKHIEQNDELFAVKFYVFAQDAAVLTHWIINAHSTITTAYSLNGHEQSLLNGDPTVSMAFDRTTKSFIYGTHGLAAISGSIVADQQTPNALSTTGIATFNTETELVTKLNVAFKCKNIINNCAISYLVDHISLAAEIYDMGASCKTLIKSFGDANINHYLTSYSQLSQDLANTYYPFTSTLNYKAASIRAKYGL